MRNIINDGVEGASARKSQARFEIIQVSSSAEPRMSLERSENLPEISLSRHQPHHRFYQSIYLPIRLNSTEGTYQKGSWESSAGVSVVCFLLLFFFLFTCSYFAMLVVLVMNERRASACLIMLSAKQGSHWYHFNAFGMTRPGIQPTTSRSRSGRSTT